MSTLSKSEKVLIWTSTSKDLGIPLGNHTPPFAFKCTNHYRRATGALTGAHLLIHKVGETIR